MDCASFSRQKDFLHLLHSFASLQRKAADKKNRHPACHSPLALQTIIP
jgi:hypothetical protein